MISRRWERHDPHCSRRLHTEVSRHRPRTERNQRQGPLSNTVTTPTAKTVWKKERISLNRQQQRTPPIPGLVISNALPMPLPPHGHHTPAQKQAHAWPALRSKSELHRFAFICHPGVNAPAQCHTEQTSGGGQSMQELQQLLQMC
jgi:hypothetical protein